MEALKKKGFKSDTGKDIPMGILKNIIYKSMEA